MRLLKLSGGGGSGLAWSSVPASSTASGTAGQIAYDDATGFFYVATATNTWKRVALSTWQFPTTIAGLQLWLDASDATSLFDATTGGSLVAADGAVARWEDKSGNNRHATQATSGDRPVRKTALQGGRDAVLFQGGSDFLSVASSASTLSFLHGAAYTVFVVWRPLSSNPDALTPVFSTLYTLGNFPGVAVYHDDRSSITRNNRIAHAINGVGGSTPVQLLSGDDFSPSASFSVLSLTGDASSATATQRSTMRTNGAGAISQQDAGGTASQSSSSTDFSIGAIPGQFFGNSYFAEICIYNSVLSDTDRAAVETYLMQKWSIT